MKQMKRLTAWLLVVLIAFSVVGCTGGKNNDKSGETNAESSQNETKNGASDELKLPEYAFKLKDPVVNFLSSDGGGEMVKEVEKKFKEVTGNAIEIKYEVVPWDQMQQKLAAAVLAGNAPDMFSMAREVSPFLVRKDLFEPMDKYFNLDDAMWKDLKEVNKLLVYKGKQYALSLGNPRVIQGVIYNTKLIEDAGLDDPRELYYKGEWTWDKFLEYVRELTQDTDGDGKTDIYGISMSDNANMYFAMGTGNDIIKFNEDGTITNNLRDPNFNRAFDVVYKMGQIGVDPVQWSWQKNFPAGKIAMRIDHYWTIVGAPFNEMKKNNEINFAPLPKDPQADKQYGPAFALDWFIPKGADNAEGAASWYAFNRMQTLKPDPELQKKDDEIRRNDWGWNDEDIKLVDVEMVKNITPVSIIGDRAPGFTKQSDLWNQPNKRVWSQVVEEIYPALQEAIDKVMQDSK